MEVWQTSNLRRLRLGEEKKEEETRKNKPQHENIYGLLIPQGDHKQAYDRTDIADVYIRVEEKNCRVVEKR